MLKNPRVVIVVLNYKGPKDTVDCLESLTRLDYPNYDVIIVDNDSSDDLVAVIRRSYPDVEILKTGENLGYVGGNNIGIQWALENQSDYVLLLNNDTEVASDFLSRLVTVAESDSSVGVVGPTIYYFDRPKVIWSAGGAIDWKRGQTTMVGLEEVDDGQWGEKPRPVDFITGCALLAKSHVFRRVGLLDARFFAYYEETEWCVRVARAGYKILHVPRAIVWHKISPTARAISPTVRYYMTRNRLLFLAITRAGWHAWLHTIMEYLRMLLSWRLHPKWRGQRTGFDETLQAILDYFSGRRGRVAPK